MSLSRLNLQLRDELADMRGNMDGALEEAAQMCEARDRVRRLRRQQRKATHSHSA